MTDSSAKTKKRSTKVGAKVRSKKVRFQLVNACAHSVYVAGTFNDWAAEATPMIPAGQGNWAKDLSLPPGTYEYRFIVDGVWIEDEGAKEKVPNPFGGFNSILVVP